MTDGELLWRIYLARDRINSEGRNFGKIELIVKKGEIKHVNVSFEIFSEKQPDTGQDKELHLS